MSVSNRLLKLHGCEASGVGSGAELLIVEGDSASRSVVRVRDERYQAVLPMQGKPLNALRATPQAVERNRWFASLIEALGCSWGDEFSPEDRRYDRLVLLFDPDADGIHCGVLMLMFFYRWMRPLLEIGAVQTVRAPLYRLGSPRMKGDVYAHTDLQLRRLISELEARGVVDLNRQHIRGLGNLDPPTLVATCVDPSTRFAETQNVSDAEFAISIFAPRVS